MKVRPSVLPVLCAVVLSTATPVARGEGKVWRVGLLVANRQPTVLESDAWGLVPRYLRELGYVEGTNLVMERRVADGNFARLPELAGELVRDGVDVIVIAGGTPPALAAKKATSTIPIVFGNVGDPVGSGLVSSLARPGGNVTGVTNLTPVMAAKQTEMLMAAAAGATRVAVMQNADNPIRLVFEQSVRIAAQARGATTLSFGVRTPKDIEDAFARMSQERPSGLVVAGDSFVNQQRDQIAALAMKLRLPSVGGHRSYAEAGGLMSYSASVFEVWRRVAAYVDKIFKGAHPEDLPVEQPTKLDLVLNRRTAKAIGLDFPPELLVLADKVIE